MYARDISRKLKENGAKNGSARERSRRVLPYSANWSTRREARNYVKNDNSGKDGGKVMKP